MQHNGIVFFIHLFKDFLPHPVVYLAVLHCVEHFLDVFLALERELILQHHLHQAYQRVLHMNLNKAEVLIALIFEDFGEKRDVMLLSDVRFHAIDDSCCPFDDEGFETVFLVQIGVHVLFEGLFTYAVFGALLVEFDFLRVHVLDRVFQLLESQNAILGAADRCIRVGCGTSGRASLCRLWSSA